MISARMAEIFFENLRKLVQSLCAPLRPSRSDLKENFYHSLIPHVLQMCTRIKIFRYRVTRWHNKTVKLQRQCQMRTVGPTFVRTESNFQKCFGGLLQGMICSCAPIFKFFYTPRDSANTEYQISNREFFDFLHTYYCDFPNNVYSQGSVFSCDNAQCDAHPAGIAKTRSSHCFCFQFLYSFIQSVSYTVWYMFVHMSVHLSVQAQLLF